MAAKEKSGYNLLPNEIDVFVDGEKVATVEDDYVKIEEIQLSAAFFDALYRGVIEALGQTKPG